MFFSRSKSYDRELCLEAAAKAMARGRINKAISEYMKVLEVDPEDNAVHMKLAPLLARRKKFDDAWDSFKIAANGYSSAGFSQKALGVYAQAARLMPKNPEVWEAMSYIYVLQGKKADAVRTFVRGHRHFRKKPLRDVAIKFLRKAFALEPWNYEVTFELARLVKKTDIVEALGLLEGLADRVKGRNLVRVRSEMFFMRPGFSMAWKWIKTVWVRA